MTKAKWILAMVSATACAISCGQSVPEPPARAAKVAAPGVTAAPDGETGAAFREPKQVRRSENGELNTTLDLRFAKNKLAGRDVETATFDGDIPGPTFRIRPGDRLKIKYTNSLKYPRVSCPRPRRQRPRNGGDDGQVRDAHGGTADSRTVEWRLPLEQHPHSRAAGFTDR